ncbi:MAG: WYL domain-containing protein [Microthrixaceae bacterium]|nr:WYL domain-containing protein [Microthrixaceae bacterium]
MNGGPSARMLALLSLLQARRDWPGHVLAERLEVTTRTVRRDVDRLRELGYMITSVKGPDGGYRLADGADLPPLLFDDQQAVAIAVGLQYAAASGIDIGEAADRALATVLQVMPSRLRHRVDAVEFTGPAAGVRVAPDVLEAVSRAVGAHRAMRFDYGNSEGPPRSVEPHGLVARNARWYLVAWDLDRADWRTFRLDRMTPRINAGPPFTPRAIPAGDPAAFVAARAKGSNETDRWPCVGTFEIDLPPRELTNWVHDGRIDEIGPDRSLVTTGSWSWAGLLAGIARFDAPFRIISPAELVTAARGLAERLQATPAGDVDRPNRAAVDTPPGA